MAGRVSRPCPEWDRFVDSITVYEELTVVGNMIGIEFGYQPTVCWRREKLKAANNGTNTHIASFDYHQYQEDFKERDKERAERAVWPGPLI